MLINILLLLGIVVNLIYGLDTFIKFIDSKDERTFTNFLLFLGNIMGICAILLVYMFHGSFLDLI